ncbi:hypothetical protein RB195_007402 [Necator americanus]|uniref:AB hydrolase-1 domain-containing protein n=1 Tax=Necator americanus TaxID=51031 RepID=A0ABR1BX47_NECAM
MKGIERITSALVRHTQLTARYPKVSQRTTVVLLGWATARDENLAKYSEIYEKEGLTQTKLKTLSRCLRMNGVYTLCALSLQYPELDVFRRTDGIIFDSCPVLFDASSPQNFTNLANTLSKKLLENASIVEKIKFFLWKAYFQFGIRAFILEQAVRTLLNIRLSNFTPYHFLLDHPQLPRYLSFIYSDKDPICPPRTIQEFHEAVKQDDRKVDVLRLTESDHVEHFRKHPKEYYAIVHRFLSSLERL